MSILAFSIQWVSLLMREIIDIMIINILLKRKVQLEILTQNYKMFDMLIRAELEHLTVTL